MSEESSLHRPLVQGKASLYLHQTQREPKETILITWHTDQWLCLIPNQQNNTRPPKKKKNPTGSMNWKATINFDPQFELVSLFLVCSSKTAETCILTEQYVKEPKSQCWTESNSHFSLMRKFRLFQTWARVSLASIKTQQVIMTLKRQLEIVTSTQEMRLTLRTWLKQGGSEKCHKWERKAAYKSSPDLETAQGMTAAAEHQGLDMGKHSHELRTWHFSVVVKEKISKRWKKV